MPHLKQCTIPHQTIFSRTVHQSSNISFPLCFTEYTLPKNQLVHLLWCSAYGTKALPHPSHCISPKNLPVRTLRCSRAYATTSIPPLVLFTHFFCPQLVDNSPLTTPLTGPKEVPGQWPPHLAAKHTRVEFYSIQMWLKIHLIDLSNLI